jgi:hypothetical protein
MTNREHPEFDNDFLGLALSLEFNECSIAAAELNELVAGMIALPNVFYIDDARNPSSNRHGNQGLKINNLYAIGSGQDQKREYLVRPVSPAGSVRSEEDFPPLVLVQPLAIETIEERQKSGWFRHVVNVSRNISLTEEPLLVAVLDEETILPLASFAKRENGSCSYVQLGSEMSEDTLFAVGTDETTSRHAIIEAVRGILGGKYSNNIWRK